MAEYLRIDRLLEAMPYLSALTPDVQEGLCEVGSAAIEALIVINLAQQKKLSPEITNEKILESLGVAAQAAFRIGQRFPQAEVDNLNSAISYAIMVGEADFKKSFPVSSASLEPNLRR